MSKLGQALKIAVSRDRLTLSQSRSGRRPMSVDTYLRKEKDGTLYKGPRPAVVPSEFDQQVAAMRAAVEKEAGAYSEKVPWYTTAAGGTTGAMLGSKMLKRAPVLGAVGGTLLGTGVGLEGGTAVGKKLDAMKKVADSMQPAAFLFPPTGSGTGPTTLVDHSPFGVGAPAKKRPGDAPTADEPSSPDRAKKEMWNNNRQMDVAMKVAGMGHLVPRGDEFPSRADVGKPAPAEPERRQSSLRESSDASIPGYVPPQFVRKEAAYTLSAQELEKVCGIYLETIQAFDSVKLASADLEELHKEALLGALQRVIPNARKVVNLGDEVVDLTAKSKFNYKGVGHKLEEMGNAFRLPKGVAPEAARAAGNMRGGSVAGRVFGEGVHSAGHHMGHATAAGKALNPLGKPVGGFIEGVTRGTGQELQRGAGVLGQAAGGGLQGAVGRGMVQHAGKAGLVGEIGAAAGTATALGHAVSPAAQGLALVAKKTGLYAPLKQQMGSLGFNAAKDVAATGLEKAVGSSGRLASGARSAGASFGRMMPMGRAST